MIEKEQRRRQEKKVTYVSRPQKMQQRKLA